MTRKNTNTKGTNMDKVESGMKSSRKWKYEREEKKIRFIEGFKSIVVFCLCFLLFIGNVSMVNAQSQSTEKVDFTISSVKDFNTFISRINNGDDYTGKIVKVTADIDFSGAEFTEMRDFGGVFDGSGHTFSGITNRYGIFSNIKTTGTVKNLTVMDSTFGGNNRAGTIAYSNYGTIENCSSHATVNVSQYSGGGIACYNYGTIINCTNYGNITNTFNNNYSTDCNIGGIAYLNTSKIINCYNQGNLTSTTTKVTAGIAYDNRGQVLNCYNTGIAGYGISSGGTISSCYFLDIASDTAQFGTYTDNNALSMTQSEMSSESFVTKLNKGANSEGALKWESGALYPQLAQAHEVTFEKNFSGGIVGSNYSYTTEGTKVTLTAKPSNKYYTKSLAVSTKDGMSVDVTAKGNKFTFTMPGDNIVVSATFSTVAIPKNLKYTKSSKTIAWNIVADATGYEVYRSTSKTANFKLLKSVTALKYADSSASNTSTYYYKVRAYVQVDGVKVYGSLSSVISSK